MSNHTTAHPLVSIGKLTFILFCSTAELHCQPSIALKDTYCCPICTCVNRNLPPICISLCPFELALGKLIIFQDLFKLFLTNAFPWRALQCLMLKVFNAPSSTVVDSVPNVIITKRINTRHQRITILRSLGKFSLKDIFQEELKVVAYIEALVMQPNLPQNCFNMYSQPKPC